MAFLPDFVAPTFAPMHQDGKLNLEIIPTYAKHLHDSGIEGIFVNGTIGEGASLTVDERKQLAEAWVSCRDLIPTVIIVVDGNSLEDIRNLAFHAASIKASAVAIVPTLAPKPESVDDLIHFCQDILSAVPHMPFLYYHFPDRTKVDVSMLEFVEKGSKKLPALCGIKFTSTDIKDEGKLIVGKIKVFSGYDQMLRQAFSEGFTSAINGTFNFMFPISRLVVDAVERSDQKLAEEAQKTIDEAVDALTKHANGSVIGGMKAAMQILTGTPVGPTRPPVPFPSSDEQRAMADEFKKLALNVYIADTCASREDEVAFA